MPCYVVAMEKHRPYYDIVFVVLVYKNIDVLRQFFASSRLSYTCRVIVVNSFYDKETEEACRLTALQNDAVYIPVLNKGYGVGNNVGSKYAMDHFDFRFLILSNSDIIIKDLAYLSQTKDEKAVYAADVRMENGHQQNPHLPFRLGLYLKLLDISYKMRSNVLMSMAFALNRLLRELLVAWTRICSLRQVRVFSAHGSFIIMTYQAVMALYPIFHEDMFLYNEELYLAHRCRLLNIPVFFAPRLKVTHLEGASSTVDSNAWKVHEDSYRVLKQWMTNHHQ